MTVPAPTPDPASASRADRPLQTGGAGGSGDSAELIGHLFDQHARSMARVIERLAGPGAHVEDLLQEVFLTAHRRRSDLARSEHPRAFLYGIALNLVRHHHRGTQRRSRLSDEVRTKTSILGVPLPDDVVRARENALRVRQGLLELTELQREVLVLYELEGLTGVEIAGLLEVPEKTVHSRLRLARAAFRQVLAPQHSGEER